MKPDSFSPRNKGCAEALFADLVASFPTPVSLRNRVEAAFGAAVHRPKSFFRCTRRDVSEGISEGPTQLKQNGRRRDGRVSLFALQHLKGHR